MLNRMVLCFTILSILVCCSSTHSFAESRSLKIICDTWPPYQLETDNGINGFAVHLIQAVFDRLDTPLHKIDTYPWKRALKKLKTGQADALFSANYTKERAKIFHYPDEALFTASWVIWTRSSEGVSSLDDLKGKSIGLVNGYSYPQKFDAFFDSHCKIEKVSKDDINFKKLYWGRVDAIVAEYYNGLYLVRTMNLNGIHPHNHLIIKKDGLYLVFNKSNANNQIVKRFSNELKKFKKTSEYQQLRQKYFPLSSENAH